ncbi:MAG: hypothetical protein ACE5EA_06325 [Nitrospirota bacterium]
MRNIRIAIKSDKEFFGEIKDVWERVERGERVKKGEGVYFESLETMR